MVEVFALIDCNSFYCSCEQVFRPDLWGKPLVVLSNNDGCVISRTKEAKALGIKMAAPEFMIRKQAREQNIHVFSSNYTLYGDMSWRVQETVREFTPAIEIYSIDELFLDLGCAGGRNLASYATAIRETVFRNVGIPTGIGIGPTKTIAKIANHLAKTLPQMEGTCDLMNPAHCNAVLDRLPCTEIWGIGHRSLPKLKAMGVATAGQLRDMPLKQARQYGSVIMEKMVLELRGVSCLPLEEVPADPKGTAVTRSFGRYIYEFDEIMEALTLYISLGAEKLRRQNLVAGTLTVFIHTNLNKGGTPFIGVKTTDLLNMTNDTQALLHEVRRLAEAIFRKGPEYSKAGILLDDLRPERERPPNFLCRDGAYSKNLMQALDAINKRHGRHSVRFATQGTEHRWTMRAAHRSPCYTTRLSDVLLVKAH